MSLAAAQGGHNFLLDITRVVRDGALLSVVASTYLLVLLRFRPRIFLRHYPKRDSREGTGQNGRGEADVFSGSAFR